MTKIEPNDICEFFQQISGISLFFFSGNYEILFLCETSKNEVIY